MAPSRHDGPRDGRSRPDDRSRSDGRSRPDGRSRSGARVRRDKPRADPARRAAYDVLRAVADRDAYANLLLPAVLTERGLTGRDAAFATELTYGTLRGRGTYDAILAACSDRDDVDPPVRDVLRLGAHQLLATRVGRHAAVSTSVDLAKDVCGSRPSGFVNAVLRRVATRDLDAWMQLVVPDAAQDPDGYLAVRHSYPRWIVEAFRAALGEAGAAETEDALAAGNARPDVVLALSAAGDPPAPGERTHWSPYGFRLARGDPAPLVASGQAAVQDEASQLAALALSRAELPGDPARSGDLACADEAARSGEPACADEAARSGEPACADEAARFGEPARDRLWLDLCAGPGGKARLLGGLAAARGARLVASDIRPQRARRVRQALRRAARPERPAPNRAARPAQASAGSAGESAVIAADGRRPPWRPGTFDRVLADVPCSGLGSLRRRPEARWRKTPADVEALTVMQRDLLSAAVDSVRPGGVVAYVTCSPHLAETRDVVAAVASARGDVAVLDAPGVLPEVPGLRCPRRDDPVQPNDPRFAQFWPHRHGTDAIFLALLRRT